MPRKRQNKRRVSRWRKLLAALISVAILIAPCALIVRLEVQWSKDQTAVIIKR
jgi:uncharacterized protein YpmS